MARRSMFDQLDAAQGSLEARAAAEVAAQLERGLPVTSARDGKLVVERQGQPTRIAGATRGASRAQGRAA